MQKLESTTTNKWNILKEINPLWLLLTGVLSMLFSNMTFSIDIAAWVSMVPFLVYLNNTNGLRSRFLFFVVLLITWSLIILKIISPPIPYFFIFLLGEIQGS